jgi:hypothetical protein
MFRLGLFFNELAGVYGCSSVIVIYKDVGGWIRGINEVVDISDGIEM